MDIKECYKNAGALLEGHFLLSSGFHSNHYLQSAKVLENPKLAEQFALELAKQIKEAQIDIECVCSPAIGGILAGYELARALGVRFIFTERANNIMTLRRGFEVKKNEKILVCEDIITTGKSAMECAKVLEEKGAKIVAFGALANRGICKRTHSHLEAQKGACLPSNLPFFALEDFVFEMHEPSACPLCATSTAIKPGSRGN
ncbi:orotate phosphoribosyltransferase [Helicobacter cetorum]|uniref:orotate phosphoribosyltransferase n=1 Tax=Helicobacter cetorum TaxID=138563 RepID=UPI000CF037EE|nr:orotate phosphoribosyltransferase [Helicobacter cetorum]